ncbi:D-2-hydroxyacid dehydrogenase [Flexivirga caeni]|uniref:D-2-hydroxyacid dehydrogenase n=1 Tax=Flexivirga caeni TaxID=2294115 RepID=A0A3M9MIG5_9MICO|nr:D-2-hydroxyacid dehydrogenase [Flexivirga caeni]RNI24623.1 D-2-hydroxyacid dehydrogenase [Flexivirga caeni]
MTSHRPVITVLVADSANHPDGLDVLADRAIIRITDSAGLATALDDAEALFLWDFFSTSVRDVWRHCADLRWIHVAAAGVDTLLFPKLCESDVVVTNARGIFDRPIAEFVLAAVLAHAKLLREGDKLQREHVWRHRQTMPLRGQRALVVGTGSIGCEIARLLRAVDVEVTGAGRTARDGDPDFGTVVASTALADHVGDFDVVVNVTPLTDKTRNLFNRKVFAAMRPSAYFVNVGRGRSVVESDLVAALEAGQLAGAALDVFETEPLPSESPLWDLPTVTVSPHLSGDAQGSLQALSRQFVDLATHRLAGQPLPHPVDKRLGFVPGGR